MNIRPISIIRVHSSDRNMPCLCGSERKIKKCCGTPAKVQYNQQADRELRHHRWQLERHRRYLARVREDTEREKAGKSKRLPRGLQFAAMSAAIAGYIGATPTPLGRANARKRW